MKEQLLRKTLLANLRAYMSLADDAGLSYERLGDTQLEALSVPDLERLIKQLRTLLRTPRD